VKAPNFLLRESTVIAGCVIKSIALLYPLILTFSRREKELSF
jgi:hypothetical protein